MANGFIHYLILEIARKNDFNVNELFVNDKVIGKQPSQGQARNQSCTVS